MLTDHTGRRLLAALASTQASGRVPSLVAAVVRDGATVWQGSRGTAFGPLAGDDPFDVQYRIGSITKTLTAVLVLRAVGAGDFDLDTPVGRWLGDVGYGECTARHLLSHSAGMQSEPSGSWWERTEGVSWEVLSERHDGSGSVFPAGERFHYSNLGYAVLGRVLEVLAGRSWWAQVREEVLAPLGMRRTSYLGEGSRAQGYSVHPWTSALVTEPATDTAALAPAGQLWATLGDLATWAGFLTQGRAGLLDSEQLTAAFVPQAGEPGTGLGYAHTLGFQAFPGGSGTLVGHSGSMPGFQAICLTDQDTGTAAVALANSTTGPGMGALARHLIETADDLEPAPAAVWVPPAPAPAEILELVGQWYWGNTPIALRWEGDRVAVLNGAMGGDFVVVDGALVGRSGYHAGETVQVRRRPDGAISHLEVATFVLTRSPYDPSVAAPGGPPGPA